MLKQRIITAVILALLFLGALFSLSIDGFALAIGLVVMVAGWEWANMAGFKAQWQRVLYALFVGAAVVSSGHYTEFLALDRLEVGTLQLESVRTLLLVACIWWAVALLWVQGYPSSAVLWGHRIIKALMGLLVLIPTWLALVFLRDEPQGQWLIILVMLVVACADIGAYFTGKAFGKRKLAIHVSPGKSWEGFWGGFVCCVLLALLIGFGLKAGGWIMLAIIAPAGLASVLGDLLESMIKRQRGIKDSSQLLPGHGGVLDRVDSITAAAPVFALAILLTGWQA